MRVTDGLKGEHGAMYPLLAFIREKAEQASIGEVRLLASCLESVLISHADIEDAILRPPIEEHLPVPEPNPDGSPGPTDHQVIRRLLTGALEAPGVELARSYLLRTVADTYRHFEKEETRIFAIAERELSEAAQRGLGMEWASRRGVRVQ